MEPVLQFDPASLSIWYCPLPSSGAAGQDKLDRLTLLSLIGGQQAAAQDVLADPDPALRLRGASMIGAVIHEQRHFVDLLLTNFGQALMRQHAALLVNLPDLLAEARESGALGLPLTVHDSIVKRRLLRLADDEALASAARHLKRSAEALAPDLRQHPTPALGAVSVGGRAQLEALAFFTEISARQDLFGAELAMQAQLGTPDALQLRNQYAWAGILGQALGLTQADSGPGSGDTRLTVLTPPLMALLYGAQMVRRWAQPASPGAPGNPSTAAGRLEALFVHFRASGGLHAALDGGQAWSAVDAACTLLFGRSASDELRADLDAQADWCDRLLALHGPAHVPIAFMRSVQAARRELVELFLASPQRFIDPSRHLELLARVDPLPIVVDPNPSQPAQRRTWSTLWTGRSPMPAAAGIEWAWAHAPTALIGGRGRIHLLHPESTWTEAVRDWLPICKLLLGGMRQPRVLACELEHACRLLEDCGIELRFDAFHARSMPDSSAATYWSLSGRSEALCDACGQALSRGSGHCVAASVLRQDDATRGWMFQRYGGDPAAAVHTARDCSSWLMCDPCAAEILALARA